MGCDYIVDDETDEITLKIWDYNKDENGRRFEKKISIPAGKFQKGNIRLEVEGARIR